MAEFYNIDPWECSLEELENNVNELNRKSDYFESLQLGAKLILNSSYGACASKYFFMHNVHVAEAITLQGQDLNHYTEDSINQYINEGFKTNESLLKKLNIHNNQNLKFIKARGKHGLDTVLVGGDTDSVYASLEPIIDALGVPQDKAVKFCTDFYFDGLEPYFRQRFQEYSDRYNCDRQLQNWELEKIARTCLYYAKKKYSMEICWEEPNIYLDPMSHIVYKGLEVVQGSTPKYARECQIDFIKFVHKAFYETGKRPSYADCIAKIREYRTRLEIQDPNDICKGQNIGDYEKFIMNDKPIIGGSPAEMKVEAHCPVHVKAAGFGNYLLFKNKKFLSKYSVLKTGAKCKFYYTKNPAIQVFGFEPGKFPSEFAPEIDYDAQFEKTILDPLNRLISDVLKYNALNPTLTFSNALF